MNHMKPGINRPLTADELKILEYIQDLYGTQNTEKDVFISENNEAVLFVKDIKGTIGICVVLTNVAKFSKDDNLSRDEICNKYLLMQQ